MKKILFASFVCSALVALFGIDPAVADDVETVREQARNQRAERMQQVAEDYEMLVLGKSDERLNLVKKPVLRWSNPLRETDDGTVYLWTTARGRPAIVLSIYTHDDTKIDHEFQSLAKTRLSARYQDKEVWRPEPGIEFRPFPGEPPAPAKTPAARLAQMRKLMREFAASIGRQRWRHELRLLTQPIHRYDDADDKLLDGAVFALGEGTDPELVVLLEAWGSDDDATWHFAPARLNMGYVELKHGDKIVWSVNEWDRQLNSASAYITFVHDAKR